MQREAEKTRMMPAPGPTRTIHFGSGSSVCSQQTSTPHHHREDDERLRSTSPLTLDVRPFIIFPLHQANLFSLFSVYRQYRLVSKTSAR